MTKQYHLRLTLDFTLDLDENKLPVGSTPDEQASAAIQRRLLQAVLSQDEHLHPFLQYLVTGYLEGMSWKDWDALILGNQDADIEDVLAPVIATLEQTDQDHFETALEHGVFFENVEEMHDCFSTSIETASLVVVDGSEAEA